MRFLSFFTIATLLSITSCTRDEKDFTSSLPRFSGFKVENLTRTGSNSIYVGDSIRVTALQSSFGKLLYRAEYSWSLAPSTQNFSSNVIYDNEKHDPVWKFKANDIGNNTLKLEAVFQISGSRVANVSDISTTDGSVVNYSINPLSSRITLQRVLTVHAQP